MRRLLATTALATFALITTAANAQIIYAPTQHQHFAPNNGGPFFYGGSDPFVFRMATQLSVDPGFGRVNGLAFASANRTVRQTITPTYSDALPGIDLSRLGYTPANAYNASQAAVPTYFRKADLVRQATVQPDGTRIVPATAGSTHHARPANPDTVETRKTGVIIIVPARKPHPALQAARTAQAPQS